MEIGDRVKHKDFGKGILVNLSPDGSIGTFNFKRKISFKVSDPELEWFPPVQKNIKRRPQRAQREQDQQFLENFVSFMGDFKEHCMRDIGPAVGHTYATGLSARIRGCRPHLPGNLSIARGRRGTKEELTWYRLINHAEQIVQSVSI